MSDDIKYTQKAQDASFDNLIHRRVEFPVKCRVRRDDKLLKEFNLPFPLPDLKCYIYRNLGKGVYSLSLVYEDGEERPHSKKMVVDIDDRKCPFVGHCGDR